MTSAPRTNDRFTVPPAAKGYRTIGPFDSDNLPAGLLREHRLKEGTWARLTVLSGHIGFAWDDLEDEGNVTLLGAGQVIDVPPAVPHHLEAQEGDFRIEIEFLATS